MKLECLKWLRGAFANPQTGSVRGRDGWRLLQHQSSHWKRVCPYHPNQTNRSRKPLSSGHTKLGRLPPPCFIFRTVILVHSISLSFTFIVRWLGRRRSDVRGAETTFAAAFEFSSFFASLDSTWQIFLRTSTFKTLMCRFALT
jgi:hypothetical protein